MLKNIFTFPKLQQGARKSLFFFKHFFKRRPTVIRNQVFMIILA